MTIRTRSVFYYVGDINESNNTINFIEPNIDNIELTGLLRIGSYSVTELGQEFARALNDAGDATYTVTINRDTRILTVSADDDFNLLVASGSNIGFSAYPILGFTGADRTGAQTYDGDTAIGNTFFPQFPLQEFVDADNNIQGIEPSVNESGSGVLEVVTFGQRAFYEFNITYITDRQRSKDAPVENNPTGLQDARDFMNFCILKSNLEFMPDRDNRNNFDTILLESTRQDRNGTSFRLNELLSQSLEGYFETGRLVFRRVV